MSRTPPMTNPDWLPMQREPKAAEVPRAHQVTEGARADRVLYGPQGEVLVRIVDRPFLGYRS